MIFHRKIQRLLIFSRKINLVRIARRQIFYLHKYKHFAATPGTYDQDQIKLRNQALHYWELPDKKREEQEMRNRKRNWHQANYEEQKRPESVTDLFDRYSKKVGGGAT